MYGQRFISQQSSIIWPLWGLASISRSQLTDVLCVCVCVPVCVHARKQSRDLSNGLCRWTVKQDKVLFEVSVCFAQSSPETGGLEGYFNLPVMDDLVLFECVWNNLELLKNQSQGIRCCLKAAYLVQSQNWSVWLDCVMNQSWKIQVLFEGWVPHAVQWSVWVDIGNETDVKEQVFFEGCVCFVQSRDPSVCLDSAHESIVQNTELFKGGVSHAVQRLISMDIADE